MKRFLVAFLAVLVLLLGCVPAWAADPKFDKDWRLVPGQSGTGFIGKWWVDGERVLHVDYAGEDKGYPGSHTIVGRHLSGWYLLTEAPPDFIEVRHNVSTARTYGNIIGVNHVMSVSSYEVISVDGIPYWRWVEEDPKARETYDFDVRPTSKHAFYEALKCKPGQKKVEIWGSRYNGKYGLLTAVLHSWEKAEPYYLPARPFEEFGYVYVPVRGVLDKLGAEISWDAKQQAAVISANGKTVVLKPNSKTALVDGSPVTMPAVPKIANGRMMIPLRFVSETLGYTVDWRPDGAAKQIVIGTKS